MVPSDSPKVTHLHVVPPEQRLWELLLECRDIGPAQPVQDDGMTLSQERET